MLKGLHGKRESYPRKRVSLALIHFLFFLRRVYKAARVTPGTLAGGLTFSLVNTPGRVTRLDRKTHV